MNIHRSHKLILLLLAALALAGCQMFSQGAPAVNTPGQPAGDAAPGAGLLASPTAPAAAENRTRGPGDFHLLAPTTGLDGLNSYRASLLLVFTGTRGGAPYQLKESFEQVVDRAAGARVLTQVSTGADGQEQQRTSAAVAGLRYLLSTADQACQVSMLEDSSAPVFEPVGMLPLLEGALAAGEETVNGVAARVYSFDALALNAGPEAQASGKLWAAVDGGWLVRYELSLRSDKLFGEGISGEQTWLYDLREINTAVVSLPERCPQAMVDLPLPDGAQVSSSLPNFLQFSAAQSSADLAAFYENALDAQYWVKQGETLVSAAGTRLVFSRAVQDKEQMAVITIQNQAGGARVTIYQLLTDAFPVQ